METQLAFDSKAKQLNLAFKERFVTDSNFQLKISGNVNTQKGKPLSAVSNSTHDATCCVCTNFHQDAEYCRRLCVLPRLLGEVLFGKAKIQHWICAGS